MASRRNNEIIQRQKGTKGKCSNERGITLASNFGKMFERIINDRISQTINIAEAQAGGQKGRATVDHLTRLKDTIKSIRKNQKTCIHSIPRCHKSIRQGSARCHPLHHAQRKHWTTYVENSQRIKQPSTSTTKHQVRTNQRNEHNRQHTTRRSAISNPICPNDGWNKQKESWTKAPQYRGIYRVSPMDGWRCTNHWKWWSSDLVIQKNTVR